MEAQMKRFLALAVMAAGILCAVSAAPSQTRGGRYDDEIRQAVARLLASKSECRNVKAVVDDGVVTLTGSVELNSERLTVVARVRRIPHGSVRTERDRHSVVELAWSTKGVKEVEAKLSVIQPDAR